MICNQLQDFYKNMSPIELVRELGHAYSTLLAERGHNIDSTPPLMNGLVAYEMLSLKGESEDLDEAVDLVMKEVYEGVIKRIDSTTVRLSGSEEGETE